MLKRSFAIGALTDIGNVKKTNEDNILVKVGDKKMVNSVFFSGRRNGRTCRGRGGKRDYCK